MRQRFFASACMALGAAASFTPAAAQLRATTGAVEGVVTDTNLVPLADASASIVASRVQVVTGDNGRFRIVGLREGRYLVVVRRLGYAPVSASVEIAKADTLRLSFTLEPATPSLDTMRVASTMLSPRMREFEERRKAGWGEFLTAAQIELRNPVVSVDLLRTFKGVNITEHPVAISRRAFPRLCMLQLFIDGVPISQRNLIDDLPGPKDIAGIEVYASPASVPLQYKTFRGGGYCGVIVVWTKDGSPTGA